MKRNHRLSKRTKTIVIKALTDAVVKGIGIACFFIGMGALAEIPTDPKQIVQALGIFILGICIIGYNSHLVSKEERKK